MTYLTYREYAGREFEINSASIMTHLSVVLNKNEYIKKKFFENKINDLSR